ncbi:MAG TPA: response regulator [Kofleriaceae bacterium]|nr:response regulator [Kofleriaceae bacterium]HEU4728343.1 response regulator [Kofleriaceae bacterium]
MADGEEKRRTAREAVALFVEYEGADDLVGDFTDNLSSGGTFVTTNRSLPVGTQVQLVLSFPGLLEPIAIEGTVRWTRGDNAAGDAGAGIEFLPGPNREALAAVVERIRSRDPRTMARLLRVLVVEDNHHVAELIQQGLIGSTRRDFGGSVSFVFRNAEDGRTAIEILRNESFDAVIIDVYLPVVDGPRVIMIARTELGLVDLPIIAVSGGGDQAREAALEAGANIFLDKPMRLRRVIETMQRLLPP